MSDAIKKAKTQILAAVDAAIAANQRFLCVESEKGGHDNFVRALVEVMNDDKGVRPLAIDTYLNNHARDGYAVLELLPPTEI